MDLPSILDQFFSTRPSDTDVNMNSPEPSSRPVAVLRVPTPSVVDETPPPEEILVDTTPPQSKVRGTASRDSSPGSDEIVEIPKPRTSRKVRLLSSILILYIHLILFRKNRPLRLLNLIPKKMVKVPKSTKRMWTSWSSPQSR